MSWWAFAIAGFGVGAIALVAWLHGRDISTVRNDHLRANFDDHH